MARQTTYAHQQDAQDLFDPNAFTDDADSERNPPVDTRLLKIQAQARVMHEGMDLHRHNIPRVTTTSNMESGAMSIRVNESEPGVKAGNTSNRKLVDKTIDVGWNEVGTMGNLVVILAVVGAAAYMFNKK